MAGLPYNCRCFTVTGNVAGVPNPSATGNNGGSGGSGGSGGIVPGVRGACSPSGPVISYYPPSDIVAQGFGANVPLSSLVGSGTNIPLTGSPFTISSSGCYTFYMQGGGGGGGGGGLDWRGGTPNSYPAPYITGLAPGGPGGIGGVGQFVMVSLFLLVGDILAYTVGFGGNGGYSANAGGSSGSDGQPTVASIARAGVTVFQFIALGGKGGQGGFAASGNYSYNNLILLPGNAGSNGAGGVGVATSSPQAGDAGICVWNSFPPLTNIYNFSSYSPSGSANWFGSPGTGGSIIATCSSPSTEVARVPASGYGIGGNGCGSYESPYTSHGYDGGNGFLLLVKYS